MLDPDVRRTLAAGLPQLKRFDWMLGTWSARNVEELPSGTSRDLGLNTYVFAYTMKKHWFFGADGKARDEFYITYDPFVDRFILIRLEGNPTYGIWTSPDGWHGNRIVFSGVFTVAVGRLYQRRLTIIHKDARNFGIYDEEQLPNGTWSADDAVELTKQE